MKFSGTEVHGFIPALIGMRLPMSKDYDDAAAKSDSAQLKGDDKLILIGDKDMKVCKNLISADDKAGVCQPNSKFLQMIEVWVCIEAPLAFWKEADTYRHAVKNSTSTMHRIANYPITEDCFEPNPISNKCSLSKDEIAMLENLRVQFNETQDKSIWYDLIYKLPDSWLQSRMFHCNYATLRNMIAWRINHKQNCWSGLDNPDMDNFIAWAKTLPFATELLFPKQKKLVIKPNPDKEYYDKVTKAVEERNGYCPCAVLEIPETKCMCKDFRDQDKKGFCHCKRFIKVEE